MLRFLTHKLRTQSLNEVDQSFQCKSDDDRDSGTESDDENTEFEDTHENADASENVSSTSNSKDNLASNLDSVRLSHRSTKVTATPALPVAHPTTAGDHNFAGHIAGDGGGVHLRRQAFAHHSMDVSISSCHSTNNTSSNVVMMVNGNSSDADDFAVVGCGGSGMVEKYVPSPVLAMLDVDSALPSDSDHFDHHSSEEELEVINSVSWATGAATNSDEDIDEEYDDDGEEDEDISERCPARVHCKTNPTKVQPPRPNHTPIASTTLKYKCNRLSTAEEVTSSPSTHRKSRKKADSHKQQQQHHRHLSSQAPQPLQTYQPEKRKWSQANRRSFGESSAGSSDEEVRDLMCSPAAPVEFRTSPPAEILRPTRSTTTVASIVKSSPTASATTLSRLADEGSGGSLVVPSSQCCAAAVSLPSASASPSAMLIHGSSLIAGINSCHPVHSPPMKLFHFTSSNFTPFEVCTVSPRKRHRQMTSTAYHHHHHPHHPHLCHTTQPHLATGSIDCDFGSSGHLGGSSGGATRGSNQIKQNNRRNSVHPVQRPCLDFEKMQQVPKDIAALCEHLLEYPALKFP